MTNIRYAPAIVNSLDWGNMKGEQKVLKQCQAVTWVFGTRFKTADPWFL